MQDTIVPKVFMDVEPKGTLSTNRSFIFIYPKNPDELSVKSPRLRNALTLVINEAQKEVCYVCKQHPKFSFRLDVRRIQFVNGEFSCCFRK